MDALLTPTVADLEGERREILDGLVLDEADLRSRAEAYLITPDEARALRRLDQIAYLLGGVPDLSPPAPAIPLPRATPTSTPGLGSSPSS